MGKICPFSNVILNEAGCQNAEKNCIGEREFITCRKNDAALDCQALYQKLRDNSHFALKIRPRQILSARQEAKIKTGGLVALARILENSKNPKLDDIHEIVERAKKQFGDFEKLPFSQMMVDIFHHQTR